MFQILPAILFLLLQAAQFERADALWDAARLQPLSSTASCELVGRFAQAVLSQQRKDLQPKEASKPNSHGAQPFVWQRSDEGQPDQLATSLRPRDGPVA